MNDFVIHPAALTDIEDIWEFLAQGSVDAATVLLTIFKTLSVVLPDLPGKVTGALI